LATRARSSTGSTPRSRSTSQVLHGPPRAFTMARVRSTYRTPPPPARGSAMTDEIRLSLIATPLGDAYEELITALIRSTDDPKWLRCLGEVGSVAFLTPTGWWWVAALIDAWIEQVHDGNLPIGLIAVFDHFRSVSIAAGGGLPGYETDETFWSIAEV